MKWQKKGITPDPKADAKTIKELADRFGIDTLTAAILVRRGITKAKDILFFIENDSRFLHNPFLFSSMEDAVDRIMLAADEEEKVLVFGDRDTDGITSTTLMVEALASIGIEANYRLPSDDEKYGLSIVAIDEFLNNYGSLIITVDCGISNHAEIEYANSKGIDVIIVDHHILQSESVPNALAIINPKLQDSGYPFRDLSGCGTAYKLSWALRFARGGLYKQNIALLNVRPLKDAYLIEAVRLYNLVEIGRISETIVPNMIALDKTRLVHFLKDSQIFVWDGDVQKKLLEKALGKAAQVNFYDVRPDIAKLIPQASNSSLLRLSELSTLGKYNETNISELDTFINLFTSFSLHTSGCYAGSAENDDALQLVALSTVADIMPLLDENRILVKQGLAAINKKPRKGIAELLAAQNNISKKFTSTDISWQLCPIINASGRMGQPHIALNLFLSNNADDRTDLAVKLLDLNKKRKELGTESWNMLYPLAQKSYEKSNNKYIVVGNKEIPRGITGLLASRLTDTFNVPAIVASFMDDGTTVASLRTARGFKIKGLLEYCSKLFLDYGGHDEAAGFSMQDVSWPIFLKYVDEYISSVDLDIEDEILEIDAELPHSYISPKLLDIIEKLEPFGSDNPQLVFMAKAATIASIDIVGKQEKSHIKFLLDFGEHKWTAMWWGAAEEYAKIFSNKNKIDLVFTIQKNYWNGQDTAQLIVLDAKPV